MASWLRRNAFWLAGGIASVLFNIAIQKGWLDRVPDSMVVIGFFACVCLFGYGLWHQPIVNKRVRLLYNRNPRMLFWGLIIGFAMIGAGFGRCVYWIIERQPSEVAATTQSTSANVPRISQPRFSEQITQVMVSLGEHGESHSFRLADLSKPYPLKTPTNQKEPLGYVYVENGLFFFDANIFYSASQPPIQVRRNQISNRPPDWDRNFDDLGFEIVNGSQHPVLQFYYKTPSWIVIKGTFLSGRHLLLVDDGVRGYMVDAIPLMP
jgi:hypothetical protein